MVCAFIDIENSYAANWGALLGVDNKKLAYALPNTAEQVVDIVQALLATNNIGLIVLDSLAAMITANEDTSSADKAVVGGTGLVIGKLYRKCTIGLSRARRFGLSPTIIAINQVREKIGVMFGDPSVMPGGKSFRFGSSLTVKVHGKNISDPKIHPTLPSFKEVNGTIQKWKVPITSQKLNIMFQIVNNQEYGIHIGQVNDYPTIERYLTELGDMGKTADGKGWQLFGEFFKTKTAIKKYLLETPGELQNVKDYIVNEVLKNTTIEDLPVEPIDEEDVLDV